MPPLPPLLPRRLGALAAAVLVPLALAACYLPSDFRGQVRLASDGRYWMEYEGQLVWMPFYRQLRLGQTGGREAQESINNIHADLRRDPDFRTIEYLEDGIFRVDYAAEGRLKAPGMATFVRRNSRMLSLKVDEAGVATLEGAQANADRVQRVQDLGLDVSGTFSFVTTAPVIEHNADRVSTNEEGVTVMVWEIDGITDTAPEARVRLR